MISRNYSEKISFITFFSTFHQYFHQCSWTIQVVHTLAQRRASKRTPVDVQIPDHIYACGQNAQRLLGSVLPAKRPVIVENADGTKFQENSIERRLVTDIERQADRQTDSRLHLVPEQCYAVVGTDIRRHQCINTLRACDAAYFRHTFSFGINQINKFGICGKNARRLSQAQISTQNTLCSSNEVLQY